MTDTQRKGRTHSDVGRQVRVASNDDVKQLLEMAFGLHQAGELARAKGLYERIIEQQPAHADALHFLGLLCFQEGDGERALALIRSAIEHKPEVAPYHDNLGTVLESTGELEAALAAFREAARLGGEDAERSFNMGVVLARAGRYDEAEAAYRRAIEQAPNDGGFHYNLATLLKARGRLEEALGHYRQAVERQPDFADAYNNLGNTLQALGQLDEAARAYTQAMKLRPDDAATHVNLAGVHRLASQLESAAAGYAQALSLNPALDDARLALAEVQYALGRFEAALATYEALLARQPDNSAALMGLASVLRFLAHGPAIDTYRPELCKHIQRCFGDPAVQAQNLAAVSALQLRAKYALDAPAGDVDALIARLADDPLLLALLSRTINVDALLERCLMHIRRHFVLRGEAAVESSSRLRFAVAVAIQCFVNEYVFARSDEEQAANTRRRARIESRLAGGEAPDDALRADCVLLAMHEPLLGIDSGERLGDWDDDAWGDIVWPLIARSVVEPLRERVLAEALDSIGDAEDAVSASVRAQYEQHPYPRWLELPRTKPVSYRSYLENRFRHFQPPEFLDNPVQVLVAGCGTGQEAISIARARSDCQVLGLDLSRRSLAYAERMADALGVDNVRFVQGDILNVQRLDRRFHIIECTGVLHHMAEPLLGWRALLACLEPGGLMKVGLYSAHARVDVARAREKIRADGLQPVEHDIRALRAEVLAAPADTPLAALAESEDLYTMSACRDLLFHAHEHRFSIPAIAEALDSLELDFIGFEAAVPGVVRDYVQFNPSDPEATDLTGWERFERAHPELFAALYVFWCRRPT